METRTVAGYRNLRQVEAAERARLLAVAAYDISLDLTDGAGHPGDALFRSVTEVRFTCAEPGASTFIEVAADSVRSATLNGQPVDLSGWSADHGLVLPGLAADNVLVVEADFPYSSTGQGLHRSVDPVDKEMYLYSQFETADAQRVYACFDQPDLKAEFTWHVTAPHHWRGISNIPIDPTQPTRPAATLHLPRAPPMRQDGYALCARACP